MFAAPVSKDVSVNVVFDKEDDRKTSLCSRSADKEIDCKFIRVVNESDKTPEFISGSNDSS